MAVGNGLGAKGAEPPEPLELLELCGACRERLSPQREPRLLPCLHSVCRDCLGATPGAAGSDGHVFECPVCHQQCPLGDIMENFFLQDGGAGTALGQGSGQRVPCPQTCTNCEDNAAATSFCLECAEPLCDTCVEAHQRVRYTRDHSVQALGESLSPPVTSLSPGPCPGPGRVPGPCPAHPAEPLSLFCSTCDSLTCRACHLGSHRHHPSLRAGAEAQRVTEGRQERLERQHRALSRAQRQQEHVLRFAARALDSPHGTALLLSRRLIHSQLLRALRVTVEPLEPQGDLKFQWDLQAWTKSAESFGTIISEHPLPPSLSPPPLLSHPTAGAQDPSPASQVLRKPRSSPKEEKFVKKLLIKRRGPPGAQDSPRLPKVPRVSLERLELDLELDPAQPPVFRIFPGPSAEEFSVIVIEQGTAGTAGTAEEQQESPIGDTGDTKPVGLLPPAPGEPGPALGSSPGPGVPLAPGGLPGVPPGVPGVSCCRVCGQAGAVVMCDRCQRCFHLHCHLPALQDVPRCQELPPPSLDGDQGPPLKLSPQDQQRCEFVLLELLCHEPCRPLQRLSSSPDGRDAIDLTLMRARLQEKLSPHYRSPQEFARDGWQLLRQFHRLTEDKADVQSILELQRFLESRLSAVFGDQKFSRLLLDPEDALEMFPGS
ncbi:PREDICTED: transcription intermediary factor 1-beta [Sturnus vulgaris]|uniref:transcription intermediary factor 1-beta n=1 Tax=Sturnus vulgaris TaxID=9172 RepID=UPI000719EE77|nr:PREDICTED: transcription intermediary factor 1-beta [Sturnus vulgaris]